MAYAYSFPIFKNPGGTAYRNFSISLCSSKYSTRINSDLYFWFFCPGSFCDHATNCQVWNRRRIVGFQNVIFLSTARWAPSVMLSFNIAMSIDYSLFLLTRYVEELKNGKENRQAVKDMLLNAGKIVLTSGGVITVCLIFLLFFPLAYVKSFGLAAALTLVCSFLYCLFVSISDMGTVVQLNFNPCSASSIRKTFL